MDTQMAHLLREQYRVTLRARLHMLLSQGLFDVMEVLYYHAAHLSRQLTAAWGRMQQRCLPASRRTGPASVFGNNLSCGLLRRNLA